MMPSIRKAPIWWIIFWIDSPSSNIVNLVRPSPNLQKFRALASSMFFLVGIAIVILTRTTPASFDVPNIDPRAAADLLAQGALVIDVREAEQYAKGHLPGAALLPLSQLRTGIPVTLSGAKDKAIVVYCGDGVTSGPEGTQLLRSAGYSKAVNLRRGMEGWKEAGLPLSH